VTYVDFPGLCSEFAAFRVEKLGCGERVAQLSPEAFWKEGATFDAVASIDVLEHLDNPVRHARRYHELLVAGGHLFVTAHFRHSQRNPDHLVENDGYHRVFGGEPRTARRCVLTNLGFRRRRWYWYEKRG
jgi:cyclopropane fatty-acyl-phospholipid synthase-like methyltransferase